MKYILERLKNPTWIEITLSAIVTFLVGSITGEIVSRPHNTYFQSLMMLITLASSIFTFRLIVKWTTEYVTNNKDK